MNNAPYVHLPGSPSIVRTYQCSNYVPLNPEFYYVGLPSLALPTEIKSSSHPFFSALHIKPQKCSGKSLLFWRPDLLKVLWRVLWGCCVPESEMLQTMTSSLGERQWSRVSRPSRVVPQCYCSSCRPCPGLGYSLERSSRKWSPLGDNTAGRHSTKGPFPPFCQNLGILLQSLPSASPEHDFLAPATACSHHHHPNLILKSPAAMGIHRQWGRSHSTANPKPDMYWSAGLLFCLLKELCNRQTQDASAGKGLHLVPQDIKFLLRGLKNIPFSEKLL